MTGAAVEPTSVKDFIVAIFCIPNFIAMQHVADCLNLGTYLLINRGNPPGDDFCDLTNFFDSFFSISHFQRVFCLFRAF